MAENELLSTESSVLINQSYTWSLNYIRQSNVYITQHSSHYNMARCGLLHTDSLINVRLTLKMINNEQLP